MTRAAASLLVASAACAGPASEQPAEIWRTLEPGLELGTFAGSRQAELGDSRIRVLRIDPGRFELRLLNASSTEDGGPMTARGWARRHGLVAAINASMYQQDYRRSVSLMRTREHVNNPRVSKDRTVLAFDALVPDVPPVKIIDRDCEDLDEWTGRYGTLVQSIRMISCDGRNVWARQPRRWSTAAIGTDEAGRVLFVHVRSPYSTHDLIEMLMELPLGLTHAMYVEGGPEAQLYVSAGGEELEFVGSFESAVNEDDDNDHAWPVPNVIGVVRK